MSVVSSRQTLLNPGPSGPDMEDAKMKTQSLAQRWDGYQLSKSTAAWIIAGSVAATIIIGFSWGGWVRGSTADAMATKAVDTARAELAAAVCVHQFMGGANVSAQLATLQSTDSWKRDTFIEEGGWVTLPGGEKPIAGAAELCSQMLMETKPAKAAAATGG